MITYRGFPPSIIFYNISEDKVYVRNELNVCHYYRDSLLCFNKARELTMSKVPYSQDGPLCILGGHRLNIFQQYCISCSED